MFDPSVLASIEAILHAAGDGSPLAIIAILGYGVWLVWKLGANHVTHLQLSLDRIVENGEKQSAALDAIKTNIAIVKDRLR